MSRRIPRRTFVRHVAAAGLSLPLIAPRLVRAVSPNEVVRHACIGVGGMGKSDRTNLAKHPHVRIVALCDVDSRALDAATDAPEDAHRVADYRALFDDLAGQFDSVNVTTPDHMHAPIALRALDAGKHLYCQKPMTRWLAQTRTVMRSAAAARAQGVVTQLGIQNHARTEFRLARWAIREGVLGKITHVHAWSNKKWGGPVESRAAEPVPTLAWDLWLGVAPPRPYARSTYHPGKWRNWVDFGTGLLGDMACHVMDAPLAAMELGLPQSVRSIGPAPTPQNWPDRAQVEYVFAGNARTAEPTLPLTWYDGKTAPPSHVADLYPHKLPETGCMIVGERGAMLIPHVAAPRLLPADRFADVRFPKLEPGNHYGQFIDTIRGEGTTDAPLDGYGGLLVQSVLLGTIAQHHPDTKLDFDPQAARFVNEDRVTGIAPPTEAPAKSR